jgi:hypothetical protein
VLNISELAGRIFGQREGSPKIAIAALEHEFAGVTPSELPSFNYRPATQAEREQPVFRMSRQVLEILRAPGATKGKGESLKAYFVYQPNAGEKALLEMTNTQLDEEITPASAMKFAFPEAAKKQVFTSSGTARLYVRGSGDRKWVFGVTVSCSIRETLN